MRSIGKKNIKLVQAETKKEIEAMRTHYGILESYAGIRQSVVDILPAELWDTWESADSEINRIINDTITSY